MNIFPPIRRLAALLLGSLVIASAASAKEELPKLVVEQEFGDRFLRHDAAVANVSITDDGKHLASSDRSGLVCIWDLTAKKLVQKFRVAEGSNFAPSLDFSPDGKAIVVFAGTGRFGLWNPMTGKKIRGWEDQKIRYAKCRFTPDGKEIIIASRWDEQGIRVLNAATGEPVARMKDDTAKVSSFDISQDGKRMVTMFRSENDGVRLWNLETGKITATFSTDGNRVGRVRITPDGKRIIAHLNTENPTCFVWDAKTEKQTAKFNLKGWCSNLSVSRDGTKVISGSYQGELRVFDIKTGKLAKRSGHVGPMVDMQLTKDGKQLVCAGYDGAVRVVNAATLKPMDFGKNLLAGASYCRLLDDGKTLVSLHSNLTMQIRDLSGKAKTRIIDLPLFAHGFDISPDGKRVLMTLSNGSAVLRDLASGKKLKEYPFPGDYLVSAVFSHDGKKAYVARNDRNNSEVGGTFVLDLESGERKDLDQTGRTRLNLLWSGRRDHPKRDLVLIGRAGEGSVWDIENQIQYCRFSLPKYGTRGDISWDYKHAMFSEKYPYVRLQYYPLPGVRAPAAAPTADRIKAVAAKLGAESFRDRRKAQKELEAIGAPAIPFLERLVSDKDPEIRAGAGKTLKRIRDRNEAAIGSAANLDFADPVADLHFQPDGKSWIAAIAPKHVGSGTLVFGTIDEQAKKPKILQRLPLPRRVYKFVIDRAGTKVVALNRDTTITVYKIPKALQAPQKAKE